MKQNIPSILIIIILFCSVITAQDNTSDEIHLKNLGTQKGKVIRINENSVEFRSDKNLMYYNYPKKDIDFIILSTGEWITFNTANSLNGDNAESSWGYFSLSGGGLMNQLPLKEADIRKKGITVLADLDFQVSPIYSIGFQLGYNEIYIDRKSFLLQNGYSDSNSTVNGGTSYLFSAGVINRFFLFPNSFLKPMLSLYTGYGNMLISTTEIVSANSGQTNPDLSKQGILAGGGVSFFISTGNRSGIVLGSRYNWLFYKKENIQFVNFNIGYVIPIN